MLDETVLVRHLQGDRAATGLLVVAATSEQEIWSIPLVRARMLVDGRTFDPGPAVRLLNRLRWLSVTPELADLVVQIASANELSADQLTDLFVVAAAQLLEAELVTLAPERYPMVPGLRAAYG